MNELIQAAMLAVPPGCFWIAWELRGVRENIAGLQNAINSTATRAHQAHQLANRANQRIDAFELVYLQKEPKP